MRNVRQNSWQLLAPEWSALDTIWRNPLPFALWPVGNQPLLAHWMDQAVRRSVERIELYVVDCAAEIRVFLQQGSYWSRELEVIKVRCESDAPVTAERLDHLPGCKPPALPNTAIGLLQYWFDLQKSWLAQRAPDEMTLDTFHAGGWIGPRAKIHPTARLQAPFWIGARAEIGADCEIGPEAFVGEGSILDDHVEVEQACILPNTYLGQNIRVFRSAAACNVLVDFGRGCRVDIGERFIMAPVMDTLPFAHLARAGLRAAMRSLFRR